MTDSTKMVPQEIKSETMLGKGIFLIDIAVIVAIYFIFDFFKPIIHPLLQTPYTVFTIILGFIITRPSYKNPQKRIYSSILFRILKDDETYHRKDMTIEETKTISADM